MRNVVSGCNSTSRGASEVIFASGGISFGNLARNDAMESAGPCTSMLTPAGVIGDEAREIAFTGQPVDERAEADALDNAGDVDGFAKYARL